MDNARSLINFVQRAFFNAQNFSAPAKASKHRAAADEDTGPAASGKYRLKHPRGLQQGMRAARIAAGQRPLKYDVPGKRERKILAKDAVPGSSACFGFPRGPFELVGAGAGASKPRHHLLITTHTTPSFRGDGRMSAFFPFFSQTPASSCLHPRRVLRQPFIFWSG
jgi:hypothetical protein